MLRKPRASRTMLLSAVFLALGIAVSAGCSPQVETDARPGESAGDPAQESFVWSPESDCGTCHADVTASFGEPALAAFRHEAIAGQCLACHADEEGLAEAHKRVTLDSVKQKAGLKKTVVDETMCLTCHDKEELAETTAGSTVLTDDEGTVVNPHALPDNADHAKAELYCSSCHKLHEESSPGETAADLCIGCHHAEVYQCGTCHE